MCFNFKKVFFTNRCQLYGWFILYIENKVAVYGLLHSDWFVHDWDGLAWEVRFVDSKNIRVSQSEA